MGSDVSLSLLGLSTCCCCQSIIATDLLKVRSPALHRRLEHHLRDTARGCCARLSRQGGWPSSPASVSIQKNAFLERRKRSSLSLLIKMGPPAAPAGKIAFASDFVATEAVHLHCVQLVLRHPYNPMHQHAPCSTQLIYRSSRHRPDECFSARARVRSSVLVTVDDRSRAEHQQQDAAWSFKL